MDENKMPLTTDVTVTLTLDDDSELVCDVLMVFEAENGLDYVALLPQEDDSDEDGLPILLYRYVVDEKGNPDIISIETDEEYDIAAAGFDAAAETMEFLDEYDEDEESEE